MRRAFEIARSGRPGPVLVDVPKDVQLAATGDNGYRRLREAPPPVESPGLERAAMLLRNAKRPPDPGRTRRHAGGRRDGAQAAR